MFRLFVLACALQACVKGFLLETVIGGTPRTVTTLDDSKYLGRWYQMYASESVASWFEKGAVCVTADYGVSSDGRITVLNSERLNSPTGSLKVIHGFATKTGTVGKLTVDLETVGFSAPYWVIKLGPPTFGDSGLYQYAVVTDNLKGTLFVLARDPKTFHDQHEAEILEFLKQEGFTRFYNKPVVTFHTDECQYKTNSQ